MDRVQSDKDENLIVLAYNNIASAANLPSISDLRYIERSEYYEVAKRAFVIIQTDDLLPYANILVQKGVVTQY